jgi:hypothetical protein
VEGLCGSSVPLGYVHDHSLQVFAKGYQVIAVLEYHPMADDEVVGNALCKVRIAGRFHAM